MLEREDYNAQGLSLNIADRPGEPPATGWTLLPLSLQIIFPARPLETNLGCVDTRGFEDGSRPGISVFFRTT